MIDETRHVFIERRKKAHSNTRAAVDLVSNLGAVMENVAEELAVLATSSCRDLAYRPLLMREACADLAERLRQALRDDQAERAAFLEHFPHLCRKDS